ncbi:zinc-binding oxidoreductase protein [Diplodia corticola]|uniref:Zinc-binding oxidoreductase protein n=1 Tax=Diplodia corticola TaxID=236234 RepID=A0A1J9RHU2_9PEZI|nr:zinc-binding oxidoreductase protein [Diplodia corticola]OJD40001.1 zinc-binding oxidoreductase protein [Diplodia corticola]
MSYQPVHSSEAAAAPETQYDRMNPSGPESLSARDSDSTQTRTKAPADGVVVEKDADPDRRSQTGSLTPLGRFGRWVTEILAYMVSLVALAAIVITLATHDGRPLPDWPFRVSINALISVFAVILKATMLIPVAEAVSQLKWSWYKEARPLHDMARFDHASRGVWGSLKFIRYLHVRNMATLGAIITVLATASDPFIQQVVRYHSCTQDESSEAASILRTNNYTETGAHVGAGMTTLDLPMQAALYQGAYNSFQGVEPACGTGNCTYPDYRTLGMCSSCEDYSAAINKSCIETSPSSLACNWTLPSGLQLSLPYPITMVMGSGDASVYGSTWNETALVTTELLTLPDAPTYSSTGGSIADFVTAAYRCSLSPCVRTYRLNVTQGVARETLVDTTPVTRYTMEVPWSSYSATPMPCLLNGTYRDATDFTQPNATNTFETWGVLPGNASAAWLPKECVFWYPNTLGAQEFLPGFLNGSVWYAPEVDESDPPWLGQLYNKGNTSLGLVASLWESMADSMTANMRRNGDASNSDPAQGMAQRTVTCVSVRWPWLAYPAALLVLTAVFLAATIVESVSRSGFQIWKGNPLALLFHGLDGDEVAKYRREVTHEGQMEQVAKTVRVRMGDLGTGMKLMEVPHQE